MSRALWVSVLLAMTASSGCSKLVPKLDEVVKDNRKAYEKAQSLPDLEVPPDLSTEAIRDRMAIPEGGTAARYSTYQERRAERKREVELEKAQSSAIRVLENEHVLAVEGAAIQVWPKLRSFWESQGYALELDDVELGILETAWNENEVELSREKFKVFAEAGEQPGTTLLYISHEGQELVPQGEDLVWERRAREEDFERGFVEKLEAELTGRAGSTRVAGTSTEPAAVMPVDAGETADDSLDTGGVAEASSTPDAPALGGGAPASTGPQHAELVSVGDGKVYLTVAEDFPRAWKATGRALEKAGVDVKDSDKGRGIYFIEVPAESVQKSESGMWNKLKFWDRGDAAEYQVSLTGVGQKTEVVILDANGRWETGSDAGTLLNKLHDALNSGRI